MHAAKEEVDAEVGDDNGKEGKNEVEMEGNRPPNPL